MQNFKFFHSSLKLHTGIQNFTMTDDLLSQMLSTAFKLKKQERPRETLLASLQPPTPPVPTDRPFPLPNRAPTYSGLILPHSHVLHEADLSPAPGGKTWCCWANYSAKMPRASDMFRLKPMTQHWSIRSEKNSDGDVWKRLIVFKETQRSISFFPASRCCSIWVQCL